MVYSAISDSAGTISQFTRKKPLVISHSGALTAYQKMVTVAYEPGMLSNFGDIRFAAKDGTYIPYWIESKTDGDNATVWFKADFIDGDTTVWMYYGNAGLSDGGNIHGMSAGLGDDFTSNVIDDAKWTSSGASISSGILNINAASEYIKSINTFQYEYAVKARMRINTYANYGSFGFKTTLGSNSIDQASFWCYATPTVKVITDDPTVGSEYIVDMGNLGTDWRTYEMIRYAAASKVEYFVDDGATSTGSTTDANTIPTATLSIQLGASTGNPSIDLDWVFVRKYTATEPTSVWGEPQHQRRHPQFM